MRRFLLPVLAFALVACGPEASGPLEVTGEDSGSEERARPIIEVDSAASDISTPRAEDLGPAPSVDDAVSSGEDISSHLSCLDR